MVTENLEGGRWGLFQGTTLTFFLQRLMNMIKSSVRIVSNHA